MYGGTTERHPYLTGFVHISHLRGSLTRPLFMVQCALVMLRQSDGAIA